jgi:hypothetical protein
MTSKLKEELDKLGECEVLVLMKTYNEMFTTFEIRQVGTVHGFTCLFIDQREGKR